MPAKKIAKKQNVARRVTPAATPTRAAAKTSAKPAAEATEGQTKLELVAGMLRRKEGATLEQLMTATSWQQHSVRGALAGAIPKKFGRSVTSTKVDGVRTYRLGA